jgi:hypothetical protein
VGRAFETRQGRGHQYRGPPTPRRRGGPRRSRAARGQDRLRHRPRPEQRRRADGPGRLRLVASHGPRAADAGRRTMRTAAPRTAFEGASR